MVRLMILSCVLFAAAQIPSAAQTAFSALMAGNPAAENRDQLMLFGQFVGDWSFDSVEYHDDGSRPTQKGEIQFRWVLHGTAVQDVWLETERSDGERKMNGTTVRFYDPKTDTWRITFIEPGRNAVVTLKGQRVGDEIALVGLAADGAPMRWIFSDIKADSFRWHGEKLAGKDWRRYEELWAQRKQ
jgi:hypothetical protein